MDRNRETPSDMGNSMTLWDVKNIVLPEELRASVVDLQKAIYSHLAASLESLELSENMLLRDKEGTKWIASSGSIRLRCEVKIEQFVDIEVRKALSNGFMGKPKNGKTLLEAVDDHHNLTISEGFPEGGIADFYENLGQDICP
jgi:hypothetical protein